METENTQIIGWRLDLVRHARFWKGASFIAAKAELFSLISTITIGSDPVYVCIYTDRHSYERYYKPWLLQAGLFESIVDTIHFSIIEISPFLDRRAITKNQAYEWQLDEWIQSVEKHIESNVLSNLSLYPDHYPDYMFNYQQSEVDSILGVWISGDELSQFRRYGCLK
jgi:hypothetical protein